MTTHGAEVNRADDIDAGISQLPGEGGQRARFVVKADDEDGPHRAAYPLFMIASRACIGWLTIRLTYDRPPVDSAPIASMLMPASPKIAASFASSPGRSGTSKSIWIMSPSGPT